MESSRKSLLLATIRWLCFLVIFCFCSTAVAEYRAAMFLPHVSPFWDRFESFAHAAADDVGLKLDVYHAELSTERMLEQVASAAEGGVDAILFMEFQGVGRSILKIAEQHKIPALLFNTSLDDESLLPRVHFRQWLGGVVPNDREAGIRLMTHLLNSADKQGEGPFQVLAYSGRIESRAHVRRFEGLKSVIDARPDVRLVEVLPDSSYAPASAIRFEQALSKHPSIDIVWSHYDQHALAAAKHYRQMGRVEPMFFGGIDWSPEAISGVADDVLDIDIGGHVFDAAQSVVMIFDYLNGYDFAEESLLFDSNMIAINRHNAHRFQQILSNPNAIDYLALSKTYNPSLQQYRFDLNEIAKTGTTLTGLTDEERRWLREHPVIRVGGESDWPPFDFVDEDGSHQGLTADYLDLLSQRLGIRFEVVTDNPWPVTLGKLKNRELDAIGAIARNPEREQFALFTDAYNEFSSVIITRAGHPSVNKMSDLTSATIAIERDFFAHDMLHREYPEISLLVVNSTLEALEAVSQGRATAYIGTLAVATYLLEKHSITNLKVAGNTPFTANGLTIGVRNDWPELVAILNKALNTITPAEHIEIRHRWIKIHSIETTNNETETITLTSEEMAWIKAHPQIRLGVDPEFAPFEFLDEKGRYRGLASEYMTLLNKRLGLNMQVVPGLSWSEAVEKAKIKGIDVLPSVGKNREREAYLNFTEPYIQYYRAIVTRHDAPPITSGLDGLRGMRVAVQANSSHEGYLRENSDIEPITYPTLQESLSALSSGEVDALVGNVASATYWMRKMNLINLKIATHASQQMQHLHFAIRKDWPELVSILEKGLNSITAAEHMDIRRRWVTLDTPSLPSNQYTISFTPQEKAWLQAHPVVRYTGDPNWLPFESFTEDGRFIGITADLLDKLEERTGLQFERIPSGTWLNALNMIKSGEVDIISDDVGVKSILATHTFTQPFLERSLAIVMRSEQLDIVPDLYSIADRRIAVIEEYGYVEKLSQRYPEIDFIKVKNIQDGLIALSSGQIDAFVTTFTLSSYHINQMGMSNLRIVGNLPVSLKIGLAVRNDWPELLSILDKAINTITPAEKHEIVNQWMQDKYIDRVDYQLIWQVVLTAAVMVLLMLLWNYSVQRQKKRLHISEQRFQLAMAAASDGIWDWNIATGDTYYSPGYLTMLGYSADEIAPRKEAWEELLHPDDKEAALARVAQAINCSAPRYEHEFRLRAKDGSYRCILSKGGVVEKDAQGNALRAVGTQTDISERKQAEDTLRKLSLAVEQSPSMVMITDAQGVIEYVNPKFTKITGYTSEEALGQKASLLKSGQTEPQLYQEMWQTITAGRDWNGELQNRKKSGEIYWERETISPLVDAQGNIRRYVALKEDITARKEAEEKLQVLQRFAETSGQGFGISTLDGEIVYVNQTLCQMLGEPSPDTVCKHNSADYYPPEIQTRLQQEILPALQESGQWTGELMLSTPKGNKIPTLENFFVIRDEQGKAIYFGNVITDISTQKRTEQALQNAKQQAEQASRFKSEFLANMSHEIRTPLNAIMGMTYLAQKTHLTAHQRDYLKKIQSSSNTLLGVINDILDFSKIEAGRLEIEQTDFLLEEVFENLSNIESMKAAEKGIEIIYAIDQDVPHTLVGDPLRLGQVLINLTSNALKFTEQGQIVISVDLLEEQTERVLLRFSVQDTGIGIERDRAIYLFDPFTQADGSTTRRYGGTGLGLAICKQLVEMMNGEIGAESEPGNGSTFYFTAEFGCPVGDVVEKPYLSAPDLYNTRVLVVDDNATTRETLKEMLASFSFEVTTVASGAAALTELERVAAEQPDTPYQLILMDWKMPGMNGVEASRMIHQSEWLPALPMIIMVTSYEQEEVMQMADHTGIKGFLIKPISPSSLFDTIIGTLTPAGGTTSGTLPQEVVIPNLQGSKVLVVEDNRINQQVAREILESTGINVTIANNGALALQAVRSNHFDLVLMDIQMPDMDGYQATRMIRKDPRLAQLPIVAMTAHAMIGDREKSLEAGMNDHLTKPIDPDKLYATLCRWIMLPDTPVLQHESSADAKKRDTLPSNLPGVDLAKGLARLNGNRVLLHELLREFVEDHGNDDQALADALAAGDTELARRLVHTLRSVAGSIGAERLEEMASALEQALANDKLYVEPLIAFAGEFRIVMDNLADKLDSLTPAAPDKLPVEEANRAQWWEQMRELEALLAEGNSDAKTCLQRYKPYLVEAVPESTLRQLENQIANFDFDEALTTSREILKSAGTTDTQGTDV